jgi:hypothetical protein
MPKPELEFVAYLTEQRGELLHDLENFEGGHKMYAGGSELRDVTSEWIASLKRRVAKIDRTIAAYRERIS